MWEIWNVVTKSPFWKKGGFRGVRDNVDTKKAVADL